MVRIFDQEKAERLDIPDKGKKKVGRKVQVKHLHKSIPELLMMGLAIGLKIVGALSLLTAAVAVVVGSFGLWGKLRGSAKKN